VDILSEALLQRDWDCMVAIAVMGVSGIQHLCGQRYTAFMRSAVYSIYAVSGIQHLCGQRYTAIMRSAVYSIYAVSGIQHLCGQRYTAVYSGIQQYTAVYSGIQRYTPQIYKLIISAILHQRHSKYTQQK
jgi:hypothetical protein